jgi:peptidoglycan hydrolase-like protein with peptidoglycan-binding domain
MAAPTLNARSGGLRARLLAGLCMAGLLLPALAGPARAQVTTRELLGWCEGALGGAVTAEFDAFQCTTYLRAMLDLEQASGRDLAGCFDGRAPDAADLMARLIPDLRADAAGNPARLAEPANRAISAWLAAHCPDETEATEAGDSPDDAPGAGASQTETEAEAEAEAAGEAAGEDAPGPRPGPDPAALELEIWRSTQRLEGPDQRRQALEHYLEAYPDGRFARLARLQLDDLAALERELPQTVTEPEPEPPENAGSAADEPEEGVGPDTPGEPGRAAARAPDPPVSLSRAERLDVQASLQALGHYSMAIDGIFGPGTRAAIRAFQRDLGRAETGRLTAYERDKLFEIAPPPPRPPETPAVAGSGPGPGGRDAPPLAGPRPGFVARNFGTSAVVAIFASPVWSDSWEHNRLSSGVLLPGAEMLVPLFDHPGECLFDIRFVDEFRFEREYRNVDVCRALFVGFP